MTDWPEEFTPEMGDHLVTLNIVTNLHTIQGPQDFTTISETHIEGGEDVPPEMALATAISALEGILEQLKEQFREQYGDPDKQIRSHTTRASTLEMTNGGS